MTRKLKVLEVGKYYAPHVGGIETHLQVLVHAVKAGVEIEVLVANDGPGTTIENESGVTIRRVSTPFHLSTAPINLSLPWQIRKAGADIVHIHWPHPFAVLAYIAAGCPGRLIVTYHSDVVRQQITGALFQPLLDFALRRAAVIIATTQRYFETSPVLQKHKDRVRVIPYGIPLGRFHQPDAARVMALRRQYGPRIVLAVGRLVYYKGFEYLVRAMKEVDAHLLLIGDGPLRPSLEVLAHELGIADRISFEGEVQNEEIVNHYHACDVFVLPSIARSEAFGIVQIEAMACGKPVVNTDIDSGVPQISLHGLTGLTVPSKNPSALSAALRQLLDSPDTCGKLGRAARERAEAAFGVDTMAGETMNAFRDAAVGHD